MSGHLVTSVDNRMFVLLFLRIMSHESIRRAHAIVNSHNVYYVGTMGGTEVTYYSKGASTDVHGTKSQPQFQLQTIYKCPQ